MAYFAEIDENNVVTRVLAVDDLHELNGQDFLANTLGLGGTWIQTSYNTSGGVHAFGGTPLHKNYAGIGYTFDGTGFFAPKPHDSWIFNSDNYFWEAPTPKPADDKFYTWNEETTSWVELNNI
jgi:hypothetical protein